MKIKILGSNGWYSNKLGSTMCTLIESKDYYVVLDAGNGLYKLDQHIKEKKPIFIFLSHFHIDHISGFHILNKFNFSQGITIIGQTGTREILSRIITKPFTIPFKDLKTRIKIKEVNQGKFDQPEFPFSFETGFLTHADPCLGYRFNLDDKLIAYCTDTGPCDSMLSLSKNSDILITECSLKPGEEVNKDWPHLNPQIAADMAKKAKAKKLLLTHFAANKYSKKSDRIEAEKSAQKIFTKTKACFDDIVIEF